MWFPDWPRPARTAAAFVVFLSGALYLPSLAGQLIWDDHVLVDGQGIGGGKSLADCFTHPFLFNYYRPLVSASFTLDRLLWRNTPFGFHQTNILLHVLTTLLVIVFLNRVFRRPAAALWGGALFAAQPTQVSAVAWIGGRTDSLAALCVAGFACSLAAGVQSTGRKRLVCLASAVGCYALAICAKEQLLLTALLIPLGFCCFDPARQPGLRGIARPAMSPGAIATAVSALMAATGFVALWLTYGPSRHSVGMAGPVIQPGTGFRTIAYYVLLLAAPTRGLMHQLCLVNLERAGAWPLLLGAVAAAVAAWLGFRWLRRRPEAAWILWLGILTIVPVLNFVPVPSLLVAPYRAGVTGLAFAMLIGWFIGGGWQDQGMARQGPWWVTRPAALAISALGVATLTWNAGLTLWGGSLWRDEKTIFTTIVNYDPYSIIARLNLTSALLQQHRSGPAIVHLEALLDELFGSGAWRSGPAAARAFHEDPRILARIQQNQGNRIPPEEWVAAIYSQLGFAHMDQGDMAGARETFQACASIHTSGSIHLGLGECAYHAGEYPAAEMHLREALKDPVSRGNVHTTLGKVFAAEGKWSGARDMFVLCIAAQPWAGQAYIELANAQQHLGDKAGARATLREALRRSPKRTDISQMLARL